MSQVLDLETLAQLKTGGLCQVGALNRTAFFRDPYLKKSELDLALALSRFCTVSVEISGQTAWKLNHLKHQKRLGEEVILRMQSKSHRPALSFAGARRNHGMLRVGRAFGAGRSLFGIIKSKGGPPTLQADSGAEQTGDSIIATLSPL